MAYDGRKRQLCYVPNSPQIKLVGNKVSKPHIAYHPLPPQPPDPHSPQSSLETKTIFMKRAGERRAREGYLCSARVSVSHGNSMRHDFSQVSVWHRIPPTFPDNCPSFTSKTKRP